MTVSGKIKNLHDLKTKLKAGRKIGFIFNQKSN